MKLIILLWVIFFLIILHWIVYIVNFIWLIIGYFCIPTAVLEPSSWVHLSYLKTIECFPVLLSIFSRWDQHSTQCRTNYFPLFQTLLPSTASPLCSFFTRVLNVPILKPRHCRSPGCLSSFFSLSLSLSLFSSPSLLFFPPFHFVGLCCVGSHRVLFSLDSSLPLCGPPPEWARLYLGFTSLEHSLVTLWKQ